MPTPLALLLGVPAPVAAPLEDAMVSVEPFSRRDGMTMTPAAGSRRGSSSDYDDLTSPKWKNA